MSIQQSYGGKLPQTVLEALCEETADFSGKSEGSYKLDSSAHQVTIEKVKTVAKMDTLDTGADAMILLDFL